MICLADTGFLVAFLNRRDQYFSWAYAAAERLVHPALTCEPVLVEAAFHLKNSAAVLRLIEVGLIRLAFDLDKNRQEVAKLATRYCDRNPDLADLCLIRMSELYPAGTVLTVDQDFTSYRKNRSQRIPVFMPR